MKSFFRFDPKHETEYTFRQRRKAFSIGVFGPLGVIIAPFILLPVIWLSTFIDWVPAQNDCAIGSVRGDAFRDLLRRARRQGWTVWPGLSNGLFAPAERDPLRRSPSEPENKATNERLRSYIEQLAGKNASGDEQLAAAHAVMRSTNAEFDSVSPSFDFSGQARRLEGVTFWYFLPAIRFAPVCIPCLAWWNTTIRISFKYNASIGRYTLDRIGMLHSDLKYVPVKSRHRASPCPSFPQTES
jgi:hypothetical protein